MLELRGSQEEVMEKDGGGGGGGGWVGGYERLSPPECKEGVGVTPL